ncbi:hypothetical protein Tco_0719035 [Tanacetum coccineum]
MVDMVNQRKKHFAEEITKAKRNKPITQSQLRIYMSNYLKNQGTWKLSQLKNLSFEEIKDDLNKWSTIGEKVTEVKEKEPVKRIGKRKKQKARKGISVDKNAQGDLETDKEESVEAMNPTPLATKSNIVKYGTNRPEDAYDRVLWSDLRTIFDPPLNKMLFGAYHFSKRWFLDKTKCLVDLDLIQWHKQISIRQTLLQI